MKYNNIWSVEVECYVKDLVLLIHDECPVIINEVEEKYRGKSKDVVAYEYDKVYKFRYATGRSLEHILDKLAKDNFYSKEEDNYNEI